MPSSSQLSQLKDKLYEDGLSMIPDEFIYTPANKEYIRGKNLAPSFPKLSLVVPV